MGNGLGHLARAVAGCKDLVLSRSGEEVVAPLLVCFTLWEEASAAPFREALLAAGHRVVENGSPSRIYECDLLVVKTCSSRNHDALTAIEEARRVSDCLILVVADEQDELRAILSLELGADAFLAEPFSTRLFLTKLHSLTGRSQRASVAEARIFFRGLLLEPAQSRLSYQGKEVALSGSELAVLSCLMSEPSRIFSRAELIGSFNRYLDSDNRALDVHITHLRQKIAELGTTFYPPYVVRKQGFCFHREGLRTERPPRRNRRE